MKRYYLAYLLCAISSVGVVVPAVADTIDCEKTQQAAERQICDHPILGHQYDRIHEHQQELLSSGKLSVGVLADWGSKLDACADVHCIDGVFDSWRGVVKTLAGR